MFVSIICKSEVFSLGFVLVQADVSGSCILYVFLGWGNAEEGTGEDSLSYCAFQLVCQMAFVKKAWGGEQVNKEVLQEVLPVFCFCCPHA